MDLGEGILESFDPELRRAFEFENKAVDAHLVDHSKVKIKKDMVQLSGDGVFYTIQGEGPTMGLPAIFVRLHVCNLACTWCDAYYTWNPHSPEFWTESYYVSFEELAETIRSTWGCTDPGVSRRVIFTGGEPLIHRKQLDEVISLLFKEAPPWRFEVETNGTLMPTKRQLSVCQFNCSPKLANSHNRDFARIKPKILSALNEVNTTFKFVVTSAQDLDEIEADYLPHISKDKVIIMPQGVTAEEVDMNAQKVAKYCKEKGFRLLGRLQNNIWGAKRGV